MRYKVTLKRINKNKGVTVFISIFMVIVVINLFIYNVIANQIKTIIKIRTIKINKTCLMEI